MSTLTVTEQCSCGGKLAISGLSVTVEREVAAWRRTHAHEHKIFMGLRIPTELVGQTVTLIGVEDHNRGDRVSAHVAWPTSSERSRGIVDPIVRTMGMRRSYSAVVKAGYRMEER